MAADVRGRPNSMIDQVSNRRIDERTIERIARRK